MNNRYDKSARLDADKLLEMVCGGVDFVVVVLVAVLALHVPRRPCLGFHLHPAQPAGDLQSKAHDIASECVNHSSTSLRNMPWNVALLTQDGVG